MIEIKEHTTDHWREQNAALLEQVQDEQASNHLWNATLTLAQYHDAEVKRALAESREERKA